MVQRPSVIYKTHMAGQHPKAAFFWYALAGVFSLLAVFIYPGPRQAEVPAFVQNPTPVSLPNPLPPPIEIPHKEKRYPVVAPAANPSNPGPVVDLGPAIVGRRGKRRSRAS